MFTVSLFTFYVLPTTIISTLSYTTLFRSPRLISPRSRRDHDHDFLLGFFGGAFLSASSAFSWFHCARKSCPAEPPEALDRKSTRLNSSHEWISYAVFCLKKKKFLPFLGVL